MIFKNLPFGSIDSLNVLVEIPAGSSNKYEYDEKLQEIVLDYVFPDNFCFPFSYGSVAATRAGDGDPLDAVVLSSYPIMSGAVAQVKPIGILKLKDRGEQDNKLITVPLCDPLAAKLHDMADLSVAKQKQIRQFFQEVGRIKKKKMEIEGFFGRAEAIKEINNSRE